MKQANRAVGATRRADRAMLAAVVLSVSVHAAGLLVLTKPHAPRTSTTDAVGDAVEVELGLDLAMVEPPVIAPATPPEAVPEPEPPRIEPIPPEPTPPEPTPPEPAPVEAPPVEITRVAELPSVDSAPVAVVPTVSTPSFVISIEPPASLPPTPAAPRAHTTPVEIPKADAKPPPVAAFAGVKADRATRVVYAVDVSGVMVGSLPFVIEELKRCVSRLSQDQEFQVILFRDPPPLAQPAPPAAYDSTDSTPSPSEHNPTFDGEHTATSTPLPPIADLYASAFWVGRSKASAASQPPVLLSVNESSRKSLTSLLADLQSDGASNPLTGLRLALSLKPDVVFLLTRGIRRSGTTWGPGEMQVMAALDEANPKDASGRRATTIRTIQFVGKDPSGLMDRIAKEHGGGSSTVLTVSDLKAANSKQKQPVAPRR